MKTQLRSIISISVVLLALTVTGCTDSDSATTPSNSAGNGLFKTSGTFSFSSDKGNFTAQGVFDTLMANTSASGAFKYTEGNRSFIMIFAYNITSQTNVQIVFAGITDTAALTSTGTYSFAGTNGSKVGVFGYIPNAADTSSAPAMYFLTTGAMNLSSLTQTAVAGSFAGTGKNAFDTTKTITLTNGSYNTPIVEQYFSLDDFEDDTMVIQEKIKAVVRKQMQPR
jgi:hypothetical protein